MKGLEAITVETLLAAQASGCLDYILKSLGGSYPGLGLPDFKRFTADVNVDGADLGIGGGTALRVNALYHDADTPVAHGHTPLLILDVWEHAYYIDYRNLRPNYAERLLKDAINWDFVAQNLDGKGLERADQRETATA